ncbi:MAG: radical SAM family heme chaperone HemW [Candidatus Kapaibacteriota bacterium]
MAGVYIHIPFCEKKCVYCDFYSITNKTLINNFILALLNEIDLFVEKYQKIERKIETIYLGGGTPSLLQPVDLERIISKLNEHFELTELKEFTIECNPGTNFLRKLLDYKKIGINRISIGVQSLHTDELRFLGRIHSKEEAIHSIEEASSIFNNVSVDIIFSIPCQTRKTLNETLDQLLALDIKHISAYSLIYEEGTPLHKDLRYGKIYPKNEEEDFELYKLIRNKLENNGFLHYEVSNFAKPGYKSIHNLGYWQYKEYFGFGPSAHSFFNGKRQWNVRDLRLYIQMLQKRNLPIQDYELITFEKKLFEKVMLGLRSEGINLQTFKDEFGIDLSKAFVEILQIWIQSGKAIIENGTLRLTGDGYFICDKLTLDLIESIENKRKTFKSF